MRSGRPSPSCRRRTNPKQKNDSKEPLGGMGAIFITYRGNESGKIGFGS